MVGYFPQKYVTNAATYEIHWVKHNHGLVIKAYWCHFVTVLLSSEVVCKL